MSSPQRDWRLALYSWTLSSSSQSPGCSWSKAIFGYGNLLLTFYSSVCETCRAPTPVYKMYHCNWHPLIRRILMLWRPGWQKHQCWSTQILTNILFWRQMPVVMAWELSYPNATIGSYIHWLMPVVHRQDQKRIIPSCNSWKYFLWYHQD